MLMLFFKNHMQTLAYVLALCRLRRGTVCWWLVLVLQQAAVGSLRRASSHVGESSHWKTHGQHLNRWVARCTRMMNQRISLPEHL
jgi:hypothetical protein